jgi:hypothetical protein
MSRGAIGPADESQAIVVANDVYDTYWAVVASLSLMTNKVTIGQAPGPGTGPQPPTSVYITAAAAPNNLVQLQYIFQLPGFVDCDPTTCTPVDPLKVQWRNSEGLYAFGSASQTILVPSNLFDQYWVVVRDPNLASQKVTVGVAPVAGQLWSKRLPHGGSAALLINHSPMPLQYMLNLTKLNLTMGVTYKVRDVWERVDILPSVTTQLALSVPAWDSAFVTLMPE